MILTSGKLMLCILTIGLGWALMPGGAAAGEPPVRYHLRIASQPLDSALQEFARQSGIQVVYFSSITTGLRAPALDGYYTLEAAMQGLLAGSKLTCRVINSRTVEIRRSVPSRWPQGRGNQHPTNSPDLSGRRLPILLPGSRSSPSVSWGSDGSPAGHGLQPVCPRLTPFGGCIVRQIFNDVRHARRRVRPGQGIRS
jgi:hypothetical protein